MTFLIIYAIGLALGLAAIPMTNAYCETVYGVSMDKMYLQPHVPSDSKLIWLDTIFFVTGSFLWPAVIPVIVAIAALYFPVKGLCALLRYPGVALGLKMKRTVETKQIYDRYRREAEAEVERLLHD